MVGDPSRRTHATETHLIDHLERRWKSVGLLWLLSWGQALAQAKDRRTSLGLGTSLRRSGRYLEAQQNYPQRSRAGKFGDQDPRLAQSSNNLAAVYKELGRYAEAVPGLKEHCSLGSGAGPNHPDVAAGLNNPANLYIAQDLFAQAQPVLKRALAIMEATRVLASQRRGGIE